MKVEKNIPFDDYCAIKKLNVSTLKHYIPGEAVAKAYYRKETTSLNTGKLVHSLMEFPDLDSNPDISVSPFDAFRSGEAKAWKAREEAKGKIVCKLKDIEPAQAACASMVKAATECGYDLKGEDELTITDDLHKVRLDRCGDEIVYDWKTIMSVHPRAIASAIEKYHYDLQAYTYLKVAQKKTFVFIFVETELPYLSQVVTMSDEAMSVGQMKYETALARYNAKPSKSEGYLPTGKTLQYEPPSWRLNELNPFTGE